MNAITIKALVRSWLPLDIDDVPAAVGGVSSVSKARIFRVVIEELQNNAAEVVSQIKLCAIAREILSGLEPVLSESEAQVELQQVIRSLHSSQNDELTKSLIFLSALLETRISLHATRLRSELVQAYRCLSSSMEHDLVLLCERVVQRLEKAGKIFDRGAANMARLAGDRRAAFSRINVQRAASNLQIDASKDWHADPWGWPEVEWIKTAPGDIVLERLASNASGYVVKLDVAKDAKSTRPALIMDPVDRLGYQCLIDLISLEIVGHLPSWVYGWRLHRERPANGNYADNSNEWHSFNSALAKGREEFRHVLRLDIRGFFSSIPQDLLVRQILRQCKAFQLFERIEQFVFSWNTASGRTGLPQRFLSSSLLAQAYLRPLDDFLSRMLRMFGGKISVSRWMDDIWLFANDRRMLNASLRELVSILDQLGLEFNSEKTKWLDTQDPEFSLMVTSSGNEEHGPANGSDEAVADRISEILANAEEAPRARFGLLNSSTIDAPHLDLLSNLESRLGKFPHIADFLANAILVSHRWDRHEDWYVKYLDTQVSPADWSVEAWAAMFPVRAEKIPQKVADAFEEKLGNSLQTSVLPLSCNCLSAWRPAIATEVFIRSATSLSTPFEFRALAFAALSTGGNKSFVEECLGANPETVYLLDMVRARGFSPFNSPLKKAS